MYAALRKWTLVTLLGLIFLGLSGPGYARQVWKKGTVTRRPWMERYQHIEIDYAKYTFMPKVYKVTLPRRYISGRRISKRSALRVLREGQEVWIRVEGHRIYELLVEK